MTSLLMYVGRDALAVLIGGIAITALGGALGAVAGVWLRRAPDLAGMFAGLRDEVGDDTLAMLARGDVVDGCEGLLRGEGRG